MGRNLFVVGHVLGTSAASRLRALLLPSCVVLGVASGSAARADCAPAAANNVTATCSGTTTNQGAGAPGTSAGTAGYGTGVQTGVTVDVAAGAGNTVTGTTFGIYLGDAAVNNNALASITGGNTGIRALSGFADVTNSGSIAGTSFAGINAGTNATVTNNATASITGGGYGIVALGGFANVTNSGSIIGTSQYGIYALTNATVTNNATGIITGIDANAGFANVTNSGSITGGQYGIRAGGGGSSVFNAGTISGGIAAIQFAGVGNTLTLALGSVITGNVLGTGSDTFQLGGTGSATFNVSQIGAAAQYRGFGTFNKIGSSAWTLTGASTFAGPINVNGGTLGINGNVTSASGVTVNAGGTLAGTGTVGNTLVTGGIFAPGTGTPGSSMTVTGALGFNPASTYAVNLNPATSSFATVSGAATLGGATVNASFAPGGYISRQYTILTAGSISGTFNPVVTNFNLPANFHDSLSYDATHAYLDLALNFAIPGGLTGNQQDVGNALTNFFNRTGGIPAVFGTLTPAGLSQAAGETATGSQQTTSNAMTQFMGVMTDPLVAGRGVPISAASGAAGYADEQTMAYAAKRNPTDALAAIYTKAPPPVPFTQRWSAWAAGFGGSQSTDGSVAAGSNNTTSRLFGVAAGADYRFSPNTVAGFALAGGGTSFGVNGFGSGRSDLFQAGAFFRHTVGAAYLSGALAYGWQDVTTDRTVTIAGIDRLRAQFNANAFSGRAEAGYRFVSPWIGGVGITPYAAGQFTTFDLPAYAEQVVSGANTFALAYAAKSIAATRSELGFRADKSFAMQSAILTLRGRAAWAHDFNPHRTVGATFQTLPGASFVVNGARQASNAALTTASAEVKWMNGFSLAGTFEGEFSNVTRSYAGKGVARYTW
ncbi:autotransporter domain-containing protein [Bradyrhizobium sp.]|uniref:autotransporter outer membrane beta-barrel domain-containing protein n=1 Tax=Bradyrhizobium sp. TaxID=376 RepID=UPI0027374773|nr:autotransporter domain-containing protein [Bradyrhizobium sp.]MDP3076045.1 autotransporter domain-containing protein [Bradyrhizobium sp.]